MSLTFLRIDLAIFFLEPVDTPCSINKFLLPCIKGVTLRTDFYINAFPYAGSGFKLITAGTADLGIIKFGM